MLIIGLACRIFPVRFTEAQLSRTNRLSCASLTMKSDRKLGLKDTEASCAPHEDVKKSPFRRTKIRLKMTKEDRLKKTESEF